TTDTLEAAMAAPAAIGGSIIPPKGRKRPMAKGRPMRLYKQAHMRFILMRLKTDLDRERLAGTERRSSGRIRTTSAASVATSVPDARAIPIEAVDRAGESLMASPTVATRSPDSCREAIMDCLSEGETEAWTEWVGIPTAVAIATAVECVSPVIREVESPIRWR